MEHASVRGRWISLSLCALLAGSVGLACGKRERTQPGTTVEMTSGATTSAAATSVPSIRPTPSTSAANSVPGAQSIDAPHGQLQTAPAALADHVVLVSVDGLAPRFLEQLLESKKAPAFAALQKEAAWTHNARTDKTYTVTLPNHTSMVTGLPVSPSTKYGPHFAHGYVANVDPSPDASLHLYRVPAGSYTASMFDVAHDNGLSTAMFASKSKFSLFEQTYNVAGAPDRVGADNGSRKIDTVVIDLDPSSMVAALVKQLQTKPPALTFVHLNQPDGAGHSIGWGSPAYLAAVQQMDGLLGQIVAALKSPSLAGHCALIVTADHGGVELHHADQEDIRNFQIPFYLWAPKVTSGDAYRVFTNRFAPGSNNPGFEAPQQPLRNGDAGNLALFLLGLNPIPESVIHSAGLETTK